GAAAGGRRVGSPAEAAGEGAQRLVRRVPLVVLDGADLDALVALDGHDAHLSAVGVEAGQEAVRAVEALRRTRRGKVAADAGVEDSDAEVVEVRVRLPLGVAVAPDADEAALTNPQGVRLRRPPDDEGGCLLAHPFGCPRAHVRVEPEDGVAVEGEEAL